jgi:hypothetical protein
MLLLILTLLIITINSAFAYQNSILFYEGFPNYNYNYNLNNSFYKNFSSALESVNYSIIDIKNGKQLTLLNNIWYMAYFESFYNPISDVAIKRLQLKNTINGILFNFSISNTCGNDNCIQRLIYVSDFPLTLTKNSTIKFYIASQNVTPQRPFKLGFADENGKGLLMIDLLGNISPSGVYDYNTLKYKCDLTQEIKINNTFRYFNYSLNQISILGNCFNLTNKEINNIRQIEFIGVNSNIAQSEYYYIDNLEILFFNGSNELPLFNVSIDTDNFCIDKSFDISKQRVYFNLSFDTFDYENDTIYYATSTSEQNFLTNIRFTRENPISCRNGLEVPFIDLTIFPNFKWNCKDIRNDKGIGLSFLSSYFVSDINRCKVDIYTLNTSNIYIDNWINVYGLSVPMLFIPYNCNGNNKEVIINLQENFFDFNSQIQMYYNKIPNNEFNITIYQTSLSDLIPVKQKFKFTILNATTIKIANSVNATLGFMEIPSSLSTPDMPYFNGYIGLKINYDYANDKFNISYSNGIINYSIGNISSATSSFFKYPIRYLGISTNNISLNDIYVEEITYGGFNVKPIWNTQKPNNVSVISFGSNSLIVYVTDDKHINTGEFNYKEIPFFVSDSVICIEKLKEVEESLEGTYQNVNGFTGIPYYFDVLRYLLQFPYRLIKHFGFIDMIQGGSIIFLIAFLWYYYSNTQNLNVAVILTFGEAVMLNIMKLIYLDIYVFIAFLFSLFMAKELMPQNAQLEHAEMKYLVRWYALFTLVLLVSQMTAQADIGFKEFNFSIDTTNDLGFIGGLWNFITNLFGFIINLFTWTIAGIANNYITGIFLAIINLFLWITRIVIIIELLPMLKKVVPFF